MADYLLLVFILFPLTANRQALYKIVEIQRLGLFAANRFPERVGLASGFFSYRIYCVVDPLSTQNLVVCNIFGKPSKI